MSEDRAARLAALRERARQVAASTQPYLPDTLWLLRAVDELLAELERLAAAERTARDVAAANKRATQHALRDCERAEAERDEARAETGRLRGLVRDFVDPDECWFDHHGYCQAHGWFATDPKCPHARAKELLPKEDEQ